MFKNKYAINIYALKETYHEEEKKAIINVYNKGFKEKKETSKIENDVYTI